MSICNLSPMDRYSGRGGRSQTMPREEILSFSCSVMSGSLRPHGLQHARPHCPSPYLLELAQTHVSDAIQPSHPLLPPSSSCPQYFLFHFFALGGQSIGVSASVLPMNLQGGLPLGWTGWISLQSSGLSRVFSGTTVGKHPFFCAQPSLWSSSHISA